MGKVFFIDRCNLDREKREDFMKLGGFPSDVHVVVLDLRAKLCISRYVKRMGHEGDLQGGKAVAVVNQMLQRKELPELSEVFSRITFCPNESDVQAAANTYGALRPLDSLPSGCFGQKNPDAKVQLGIMKFLKKVRHRNVVQLIGACTRPPNLYIVAEFMSGGSVYHSLHKQNGFFKLPTTFKVAIDVSKGMNYLHQNNIIHRDLKATNILIDENEVVKVADFGIARMQGQSRVMIAKTGISRWMAPEVIEHKPYDQKANIFSFGIILWELLTG